MTTSVILDYWLSTPLLVGATIIVFIHLDLKLTRWGFFLSQQQYAKHVKSQGYELNPLHQEAIHQNRPIKTTAWVLWILILISVIILSIIYQKEGSVIIEIGLGAIFWIYFNIIHSHFGNIFNFRYLNNNPEAIQGEIEVTPKYSYGIAKGKMGIIGFLCLVTFILVSEFFFLGGFFGSIVKYMGILIWGAETEAKPKAEAKAIAEAEAEAKVEAKIEAEAKAKAEAEAKTKPAKKSISCPKCKRVQISKTNYCIYCGERLEW